jgi:hypothetical protein
MVEKLEVLKIKKNHHGDMENSECNLLQTEKGKIFV